MHTMNSTTPTRAGRGQMRPATSLPHIARGIAPLPSPSTPRGPCPACGSSSHKPGTGASQLFQSNYQYEPQFEYCLPRACQCLEEGTERDPVSFCPRYVLYQKIHKFGPVSHLTVSVSCLRKQLPSKGAVTFKFCEFS